MAMATLQASTSRGPRSSTSTRAIEGATVAGRGLPRIRPHALDLPAFTKSGPENGLIGCPKRALNRTGGKSPCSTWRPPTLMRPAPTTARFLDVGLGRWTRRPRAHGETLPNVRLKLMRPTAPRRWTETVRVLRANPPPWPSVIEQPVPVHIQPPFHLLNHISAPSLFLPVPSQTTKRQWADYITRTRPAIPASGVVRVRRNERPAASCTTLAIDHILRTCPIRSGPIQRSLCRHRIAPSEGCLRVGAAPTGVARQGPLGIRHHAPGPRRPPRSVTAGSHGGRQGAS